jgi:hypothetical protein
MDFVTYDNAEAIISKTANTHLIFLSRSWMSGLKGFGNILCARQALGIHNEINDLVGLLPRELGFREFAEFANDIFFSREFMFAPTR